MTRRRKLLFVPGLISLALLLPSLLWWLTRVEALEKKYVLNAVWHETDYGTLTNDFIPVMEFETIWLDGNAKSDDRQLVIIKRLANELNFRKDSLHGIHVHLAPTVNYQSIVSLFALSSFSSPLRCVGYKDDLWIYYTEKRTEPKGRAISCGTMYSMKAMAGEENWYSRYLPVWQNVRMLPVLLLLMVLIGVSFRK
jgi:hypothetical protein